MEMITINQPGGRATLTRHEGQTNYAAVSLRLTFVTLNCGAGVMWTVFLDLSGDMKHPPNLLTEQDKSATTALMMMYIFVCHSSLNGNNGEWTGDDDMSTHSSEASLAQADRARAKKSADSHVIHGAVGNSHKPAHVGGAGHRVGRATKDASLEAKPVSAIVVKMEAVKEIVYCVDLDISDYLYDYEMSCYRVYTAADKVVNPGFLLEGVTKESPGMYEVTSWPDKRKVGKSIVSSPCITVRRTKGDWGTLVCFRVAEGFLRMLTLKLPSFSSSNIRDMSAAAALISTSGGTDTAVVAFLSSTLNYYISSRKEIAELASSRRFQVPTSDMLTHGATYNSLSICNDMNGVWEEGGINLPLMPYVVRSDIEVTCKGRASFVDGVFAFGVVENEAPKWVSKKFFEILGRQQLSRPDNNGGNLITGLGRLFGEDAHAPYMRVMQERLAVVLNMNGIIPTNLLRKFGYAPVVTVNGTSVLRATNGRYADHMYEMIVERDDSLVLIETMPRSSDAPPVNHDLEGYLRGIGWTAIEFLEALPAFDSVFLEFVAEMRDRVNPCAILTNKSVRREIDAIKTDIHQAVTWTTEMFFQAKDWCLGAQASRESFARIEHVKQQLRISYTNDLRVESGYRPIQCKVKGKNEPVKNGKRMRVIASFGEGCMIAPHLAAVTKHTGGYYRKTVGSWDLVFYLVTYPSSSTVAQVFDDLRLIGNAKTIYIAACGDDMIGAFIYSNGWKQIEMDISSCDTNQRVGTWCIGAAVTADWPELVGEVLDLAMIPLYVKNPSDKSSSFSIKPLTPIMSSGHPWTSFNNGNIAGCVGHALLVLLDRFEDSKPLNDIVAMAALLCGHRLSIVSLEAPEQQTFLKNHPVMCIHPDGRREPKHMLCLGTYLRSFGVADNTLSAESIGVSNAEWLVMPPQEIADRYERVVIAGLVHQPHNPILDALRLRFQSFPAGAGVPTKAYEALRLKHVKYEHEDLSEWTVDPGAFRACYGFDDHEVTHLCNAIINIKIGDRVCSSAVEKILGLDYSISFDEEDYAKL